MKGKNQRKRGSTGCLQNTKPTYLNIKMHCINSVRMQTKLGYFAMKGQRTLQLAKSIVCQSSQ